MPGPFDSELPAGYKAFMIKQRILIIGLAATGILLAGLLFSIGARQNRGDELIAVTSDSFGGPFTLVDQNGKTVTDKDYAGRYRLIYFGFTYCPAICPTELQKITAALTLLGDKGKKIQPLFITVDPERDTPEKMKGYVTLFHPSLIGLSGTRAQIDQVLKSYKIYAAKAQDPGMTEYTMDHSSLIYFMAPDGRLLRIFKIDDTAQAMADTIAQWLDQEPRV